MARIVAIHGIAQQFRGEHLLAAEWLPALRDGLNRAGAKLERDDDLAMVFYGDLFRPRGKAVSDAYDASEVEDDWEKALLAAWWEEAARVDVTVQGSDFGGKGRTPAFVQRALEVLSHSKFFAGAATWLLIADLKQVRAYVQDDQMRASIQARVGPCIGSDTRIVIGHSLGSVVAYEALAAHPEWPARKLVTLGSPLGIRNLIFDRLRPAPVNGTGAWPGAVSAWTNVADAGDIVALNKRLASLFGSRVQDESIDNGAKAHDVCPYLTCAKTGQAISAGLADCD
jgi:pimeloyl-ACP methyl ester carboxylesterase